MFDYLEKFNKLPKDIHDKLSNRKVLNNIEMLETKYKVDLVSIVIRVVVKDIALDQLVPDIIKELNLDSAQAENLAKELKETIFIEVADYLGIIVPAKPEEFNIEASNELIAENIKELAKSAPIIAQIPLPETPKPPVAVIEQKFSPFFFHAEDEEEIKELSKKIDSSFNSATYKTNIDENIDSIVKEMNINFSSEAASIRFKQILKTYFLGIRNRMNIIATFGKSFDAGGLGLDEKTIDRILNLVDGKISLFKDKISSALTDVGPSKSRIEIAAERDIPYDLKKEIDNRAARKEQDSTLEALDTSHELVPPYPVVLKNETNTSPANKNIPIRDIPSASKPTDNFDKKKLVLDAVSAGMDEAAAAVDNAKMALFLRSATAGNKVKMNDVKYIPRDNSHVKDYKIIMGPIDELKNMDTVNFRRLDKNPETAANKIKEKINLLEEEEYSKKIEGIKGWRVSPIHKLYLDLGQQSIIDNIGMDAVSKKRKEEGKDYLSEEEIAAIMELNKSLRF